jgi:CDP-diacylglycerol--glycerol-3-phosphate 3-phosphatidyltransferase
MGKKNENNTTGKCSAGCIARLPNRLTIFRVILTPIFVAFLLCHSIPGHLWIALIVYMLASVTDYLDGRIARKYNLISDFGKFLDPIADKILVAAALVIFSYCHWIDPVAVFLILAREMLISGIRMTAAARGAVIAADISGKLKTFFTLITIIVILFLHCTGRNDTLLSETLIWISVILTWVSGIRYLNTCRDYVRF